MRLNATGVSLVKSNVFYEWLFVLALFWHKVFADIEVLGASVTALLDDK